MAKLRRLAIFLAAVMVTLGLPTAIGAHLSVGTDDAVGAEAQETGEDPSVPGDEPGDPSTMYGVGTTHPADCYDPGTDPGPDEAQEAAQSEGFCGELVYNVGSGYERASPPDQDRRAEWIGTFDVQRTYFAGKTPLAACVPMCQAGDEHHAHWYAAEVHVRNAPGIVQDRTDAWQADGWAVPFPSERWVGWLADADGDPISEDELDRRLDDQHHLGHRGVCGFSPDADFVSVIPQLCDVYLEWKGPPEDEDETDRYEDRCTSAAYVCGPTTEAYWAARSIGLAVYAGTGEDYTVWHWTVAPAGPDCYGAEPGFDPDPEQGQPYLAHDLDVYTPPTALSGDAAPAYTNVRDHAIAAAEAAPGHLQPPEHVDAFLEDDMLERNHVGAESYAIDDDSRQRIQAERSFEDNCQALHSPETEETLDPWVNLLDAGIASDRSIQAYSLFADEEIDPPTVGLYGSGEDRDADNDPTPDTYATEGKVGVFADKDDDGAYDQVRGSEDTVEGLGADPFAISAIQHTGAYPMAWDMHVAVEDGQPTVDRQAGCEGDRFESLTAAMDEAGYGPNTGLAQVVYLAEPTVFYDRENPEEALPVPQGAALLASQAVHALWDGEVHDAEDEHRLSEDVDRLVEATAAYLDGAHGVPADELELARPGQALGMDSDYESQCGQSTGGFTSRVGFTRACEPSCEGATIATMYSYEIREDADTIGGQDVPHLYVDGERFVFPDGEDETRWFDIDPFDGDADRNEARDGPPPH